MNEWLSIVNELPAVVLENAIAIYLYGSVARGDVDGQSDCDLLVVVKDCNEALYSILKNSVSEWHQELNIEFAFYQLSMIEKMHHAGSYFLWHIKLEGIELFRKGPGIINYLRSLPEYLGTIDDLDEYEEILYDIKSALRSGDVISSYELAVLAILVRNTCIGACYINNMYDFGRRSPVIKCIELWGARIPFTIDDYDVLYKYRIAYTRGIDLACCESDLQLVKKWVERVELLLRLVRE